MSITSTRIRQGFLDFFREKDHLVVPSASLVPHDDPTLLFTNAGMNQFKDYFLGLAKPPHPRIADSQKCMRVSGKHNDLEDVGPSPYHHTFFEMLGNWSFGEYYKKEAIGWAWELLTGRWGLQAERLYATVFEDDQGDLGLDEEVVTYWHTETTLAPSHIHSFGRKDNFWEMGETGPCGPCSEIHYDRGEEFCNKRSEVGHICRVNGDCRRFIELWNLVFIQYDRRQDGLLEPLPKRHVDTGMGLERIAMILQGVESNYATDLFTPILDLVQEMLGHSALERREHEVAYRVIADHGRAITFMIGDGVLPGNEGRSYVLRLILRRAARFGRKAGFTEPFLARVADQVIAMMGGHYSELESRRQYILNVITQEEERFYRTYEHGLQQLSELIADLERQGESVIPGEEAFKLHATYGFPIELTRLIAAEHQLTVDDAGYGAAMAEHEKISASGAFKAIDETLLSGYARLLERLVVGGSLPASGVHHDPHSRHSVETEVVALLKDGAAVERVHEGEEAGIVLASSPFYVEAGGQVSDTGWVEALGNAASARAHISDVRAPVRGLITHNARVVSGSLKVGMRVQAYVDLERRVDIMRNHTATHLLHAALRRVLGEHVMQAGSLVAPDHLRFDFSHPRAVSQTELAQIEVQVNEAIYAMLPVDATYRPYAQAVQEGAIALFGEKYGDEVRVVRIEDEHGPASMELCGGTHVANTAQMGLFIIAGESSVAAGIRRIEALTGRHAYAFVKDRMMELDRAAHALETAPEGMARKAIQVASRLRELEKQLKEMERKLARQDFDRLMQAALRDVNGVKLVAAKVDVSDLSILREMSDWFRDRIGSGVVVLGAVLGGRPHIVAAVTNDLLSRGLNASHIVCTIGKQIGGGGGGKATLAQAGGKDASRLGEALDQVEEVVRQTLA